MVKKRHVCCYFFIGEVTRESTINERNVISQKRGAKRQRETKEKKNELRRNDGLCTIARNDSVTGIVVVFCIVGDFAAVDHDRRVDGSDRRSQKRANTIIITTRTPANRIHHPSFLILLSTAPNAPPAVSEEPRCAPGPKRNVRNDNGWNPITKQQATAQS